MTDRSTAETFGLAPDPACGRSDVPLALDALDGQTVIVDDGVSREPALLAVDVGLFLRAGWYRREAARLIATWRAGNLFLVSSPEARGQSGQVDITDETGAIRIEEVPWPTFRALRKPNDAQDAAPHDPDDHPHDPTGAHTASDASGGPSGASHRSGTRPGSSRRRPRVHERPRPASLGRIDRPRWPFRQGTGRSPRAYRASR